MALGALILAGAGSAAAAPVINEIMYRPGTGYPENTAHEFIELHNPDAVAVDLAGWAITTGADFTFPAGTTLSANGYLVVAANPAALQAATGLTGVLGPWASGARLANNGEKVTLARPGDDDTWTIVDQVEYASEGDWATRTRDSLGGWSWVTAADSGKSLERRNPRLASTAGANWGPSPAVGGSPGAANSLLSSNVAPVITEVKHSPAVPTSSDRVTISCELTDESASSELAATLYWRNATTASPGGFQAVAMTVDSSGRYVATLDALANKQIVEFYVSATDGVNTRTWPAPSSEGQNTNCTYQVDNEIYTGASPVYRLVLTAAENTAFESLARQNPQSDRQFNVTLVARRGSDATIRYLCSMRIRGNSSRQYTYKPLHFSIPNDRAWDGVSRFNLNPKASYLQYLAMRLQVAAGLVAADATPVELRRQGTESTVSSGTTGDYGQWVRVEDFNSDYLDNHFSTAQSAQVYRKTSISSWAYTTSTAPTNPEATWSGWSKQNNSAENDWSDVMAFTKVWQDTAASHFTGATSGNVAAGTWNGVAFTDAEVATLAKVADLDYLARWLAVMTIMLNNEPNLSTGEDDDYAGAFIHDGTATRLVVLPHDMDTILGTGDGTIRANAVGLYDATEVDTVQRAGASQVTLMKPLVPLLGNSTTAGNPAFRAKYLTAIRELFGSVFDADTSANANPAFYQFVDNHLAGWASEAVRTSIKSFMTQRQTYLLGLLGAGKITPTAATSTATRNADGTPTVRINEVLASNVTAYSNGSAYPDVIELHNSGANAVDLAGLRLGDATNPTAYTFPSGAAIPAGGYLLVYADSLTSTAGLHSGFALDAEGDVVYLYDTAASGGALLDSIEFGFQIPDTSIARTSSAPGTWALCAPTLGTANGNALPLGSIASVVINEWAGAIQVRTDKDFIELYNPLTSPVALGGAAITDDLLYQPARYKFRKLGFIPAGGFLVLDTDKLEYGLDGDFEQVFFVGENGSVIDRVDFTSQPEDHSTGRTSDGATSWSDFAVPTPGLSNATALPAGYSALLSGLRVTEIMYQPTATSSAGNYEFIEVQNVGTAALDISGVRFTNGIDYTFPSGTVLAANAYLVVCKNRTAFLSRYPSAAGVLAPDAFAGALDNSGETLALTLPSPWNVHILKFRYEPVWYARTAGGGYSLVTVDPATTAVRDWDEKSTWTASASINGNPGGLVEVLPVITSVGAAAGTVNATFAYQITASGSPTSFGATGLPAGLNVNSSTGLISGVPVQGGSFTVMISATNGSGTGAASLALEVSSLSKITGAGVEVGQNIQHPNGNVYDQVLLTGDSLTVTADAGQVTRTSFIDLDGDIIQIEFSGAGAVTLTLLDASGPAKPVKYNQDVTYMRGHATILFSAANETSNLSVFSVGRENAVNQGLFKSDAEYDGVADIGSVSITSTSMKFGGLRTANTSYFATTGITGVYAPDVQFTGPVFVGDISAYDAATPVLVLGTASDVRITGGDLAQANGKPVAVDGITQLKFTDGATSHGTLLPAQANKAKLEQDGVDVTATIVVPPGS